MREIVVSGLNTGVLNSASAAVAIEDLSDLVVNVAQASGNIAGAVITIQQSVNGSTWVSTAVTITGAALSATLTIAAQYMRLLVTTASGAASTATCTIQGKPGDLAFLTATATRSRTNQKSVLSTLESMQKTITSILGFVSRTEKEQRR